MTEIIVERWEPNAGKRGEWWEVAHDCLPTRPSVARAITEAKLRMLSTSGMRHRVITRRTISRVEFDTDAGDV